jgi:hypothetical protein
MRLDCYKQNTSSRSDPTSRQVPEKADLTCNQVQARKAVIPDAGRHLGTNPSSTCRLAICQNENSTGRGGVGRMQFSGRGSR